MGGSNGLGIEVPKKDGGVWVTSWEMVELEMDSSGNRWWPTRAQALGKPKIRTPLLISVRWSGLNAAHDSTHHLMSPPPKYTVSPILPMRKLRPR